jgi:DNA processing protein
LPTGGVPQKIFQKNSLGNAAMYSQEIIDELRLALVPGVGPRIRRNLLERFNTAANVLATPVSQLREVAGVGGKLGNKIALANQEISVEKELDVCEREQLSILLASQSEPDVKGNIYPRQLAEIYDPPAVMFCKGTLLPQDTLSVAIVGTRHCTTYGRRMAERLGGGLARAGLTVVSGLARGIDGAAHKGALAAGGRTLAVLGSGVLNIYPPEHKKLAEEVAENGALLSENPPQSPPLEGAFPRRNRIITGLSLGLIVVEAALRSGALISVRHAVEQNREVFAVPGPVDSTVSRGCHKLLKDGVTLVESVDDVLDALGPLVEQVKVPRPGTEETTTVAHPAELKLNDTETKVLQAISQTATLIDDVVASTGLPVPRVLATISVLEMRRLIRRVSGGAVIRG